MRAFYRLQLNPSYTFKHVLQQLDYFEALGISHLYFSPITTPVKGSMHGYDVIDPTRINPELGTEEDLKDLVEALHARKMGILLDIVPNHMSCGPGNPWWDDILVQGQKSPFACYFDICWDKEGKKSWHRRFFDHSGLVCMRMEEPEVFDQFHQLPFDLIRKGWVDGLRIDHIDGLFNPIAYLQQVAKKSPYNIVEKILVGKEPLRANWPVEGTTGYDFLNQLNGLFVKPEGWLKLQECFARFTGLDYKNMQDAVVCSKYEILGTILEPELDNLMAFLPSFNFEKDKVREALRRFLAQFPVYRTYIGIDDQNIAFEDRTILDSVSGEGAEWEWLKSLFFNRDELARAFVLHFQQISGPAMAKGAEDTAFYRYIPLASVNEVGMDLVTPVNSIQDFHAQNRERLEKWPKTLLSTSTHDTKRSEDVRARLNVLSEIPDEWEKQLTAWHNNFSTHAISLKAEYLLYQTLIGAFPATSERIVQYMLKAEKEAKQETSWMKPNSEYESGIRHQVETLFANQTFMSELQQFVERIEAAGFHNSLVQQVVKLTSPGIPDIYQGEEQGQWSLVDPDNRRPIDYEQLQAGDNAKQALIRKLLQFRKNEPELFEKGEYIPLDAGDAIAYGRQLGDTQLIVISRRFLTQPQRPISFTAPWDGEFEDLLTGDRSVSQGNFFVGYRGTVVP